MKVLIACEWSGTVRDAFRARGHDAYSCDLVPDVSPYHLRDDVRRWLREGYLWDLMIAFPPCTYLSNAGNAYMSLYPARQAARRQAIEFVQELMDAPIPRIAIENPAGVISTVIRKPDQYIQPWWFGDGYSKRTGLWLKGLPLLVPDRVADVRDSFIQPLTGETCRTIKGVKRGETFPGIARAMAEQWGKELTA